MDPWMKKRFRIAGWPVNVEDNAEYDLNGDIVSNRNSEKPEKKKSHRNLLEFHLNW